MNKQVLNNSLMFLIMMLMQVIGYQSFAQNQTEGAWTVRYNTPAAQDVFTIAPSNQGFIFNAKPIGSDTKDLYAYYHLKLNNPI